MLQGTLLLVSSAFLHAAWNALAKKTGNTKIQLLGIFIVNTLFSLMLVPLIEKNIFFNLKSLFWIIFSGIFEAGYVITLGLTLAKSSFGSSYTIMRGGAMLLVWLISGLFLKESVSVSTLIGVSLLIFGMNTTVKQNLPRDRKTPKNTSAWPYACACFIAGYHLCYGQALAHGAQPLALLAISLCVALPIMACFYGKKSILALKNEFLSKPMPILIAGILSSLSFIFFLFGLRSTEAGYALTLRNTSIVFAQALAFTMGEKISKNQWIGSFLVTIGAALVSLI